MSNPRNKPAATGDSKLLKAIDSTPTPSLGDQMADLVGYIREAVKHYPSPGDEHHSLMHDAAARFNLYRDDAAPVWLSRVVSGVIEDVGHTGLVTIRFD